MDALRRPQHGPAHPGQGLLIAFAEVARLGVGIWEQGNGKGRERTGMRFEPAGNFQGLDRVDEVGWEYGTLKAELVQFLHGDKKRQT